MQDLSDDERKEVLGEVLADELKVIQEYVRVIPKIEDEVHEMHVMVNDMNGQLKLFEHIVREHDSEIKQLKQKLA